MNSLRVFAFRRDMVRFGLLVACALVAASTTLHAQSKNPFERPSSQSKPTSASKPASRRAKAAWTQQ